MVEYLQNYFLNFYQETYCEKLPYHIVLGWYFRTTNANMYRYIINYFFSFLSDKVILNNGNIIAEYGVSDYDNQLTHKNVTSFKNSILDSLPKDVVNSYVSNWCNSHTNISCDAYNSDKIIDNLKLRTINESNSANDTNSNDLKIKINNFNQSVQENSSNCSQNPEEHIYSNDLNRKLNQSAINEVPKKSGNCPLDPEQQINSEMQYISSDDSCFKNIDTFRESGILTIPSSDTSQESGTINDVLNKCIIINSSAETCTKRRSSPYDAYDSSVINLEKNIIYSIMTSDFSDNSKDRQGIDVINITSDISARSDKKSPNKDDKSISPNQELDHSVISITEEYKYVDKEQGIVLIEKRILVNPKM